MFSPNHSAPVHSFRISDMIANACRLNPLFFSLLSSRAFVETPSFRITSPFEFFVLLCGACQSFVRIFFLAMATISICRFTKVVYLFMMFGLFSFFKCLPIVIHLFSVRCFRVNLSTENKKEKTLALIVSLSFSLSSKNNFFASFYTCFASNSKHPAKEKKTRMKGKQERKNSFSFSNLIFFLFFVPALGLV